MKRCVEETNLPAFKMQMELEDVFNKSQLREAIQLYFSSDELLIKAQKVTDIPKKFFYKVLTELQIHKRVSVGVLVGMLRNLEEYPTIAFWLEKMVSYKLIQFDETTGMFVMTLNIPKHLQQQIDRYQYPLPMLVVPNRLEANDESAYINQAKSVLSNSVILNNSHHMEEVNLDHINQVNTVPLAININVLTGLPNKWKSIEKAIKRKAVDTKEFKYKQAQLIKFSNHAVAVLKTLHSKTSKVYLTHKYDLRGRYYSQGYLFNYQGNDWQKAVVLLANKQHIR